MQKMEWKWDKKWITNEVFPKKSIDPKLHEMPHYQTEKHVTSYWTKNEKKPLRHMLQQQINVVKNVHWLWKETQ